MHARASLLRTSPNTSNAGRSVQDPDKREDGDKDGVPQSQHEACDEMRIIIILPLPGSLPRQGDRFHCGSGWLFCFSPSPIEIFTVSALAFSPGSREPNYGPTLWG